MKSIFCVVALLATLIAADNDNNFWPSYLTRCEKYNPNFDKCLLVRANEAMRYILQGDTSLGIPQYNQFTLKNITFGEGQTWKLHFDEITVSGFEHYHVFDIFWDLKKKTIDISLKLNSAEVCNGNYVSSGTYGGIDINGYGNMDLIFVGGNYGANVSYSMKYDLMKIQGRDYVQIKESKCVSHKGLRFNFNNMLKSKEETDSDIDYINTNIDIGKETLLKETSAIMCKIINSILNPLFYNFHIDLIVPDAE